MRGKLSHDNIQSENSGITPADAGKTTSRNLAIVEYKDHPRGCGENNVILNMLPANLGSPPRMRGKRAMRER